MVVSDRRRRPATAALVIPDEQTWTVAGRDPADQGLEVTYAVARARHLLVAEDLPPELSEPLAELGAVSAPGNGGHEGHDMNGHEGHDMNGHEGHDMSGHKGHDMSGHEGHDMMAIVGEPSADGLVMEPIELRYGPLATPLPGGLAAEVTLDGDVVADATIEALLRAELPAGTASGPPDALAPAAWAEVMTRAIEAGAGTSSIDVRLARVGGVEVERAISHLAWLRSFMRLLGWGEAVASVTAALRPLSAARRSLSAEADRRHPSGTEAAGDLGAAAEATDVMARRLRASRALRLRTRGRGTVGAQDAAARGLAGPVARACGLNEDARADDPLYRVLGFEPLLRDEGDAHARTMLRVEEAHQSTVLALTALGSAANGDADSAEVGSVPATVEGPRGPLRARRRADSWELEARGAQAARSLAGELMIGAEWATALVILASFDLSPWAVGA